MSNHKQRNCQHCGRTWYTHDNHYCPNGQYEPSELPFDSYQMNKMKEYKVAFKDGQEATLQLPDDVDLDMEFMNGLIGLEIQDAVAKGICKITERVWPCFYCNRKFLDQTRLQAHLKEAHKHEELRTKTHKRLKEHKGVSNE